MMNWPSALIGFGFGVLMASVACTLWWRKTDSVAYACWRKLGVGKDLQSGGDRRPTVPDGDDLVQSGVTAPTLHKAVGSVFLETVRIEACKAACGRDVARRETAIDWSNVNCPECKLEEPLTSPES